ncbi:MAG: biotin--[acetyl-CoA-carboxylase] ligase [Bacteroidia bacterium]
MKTIFIGKNCIEVDKTDSTNSYLARLQDNQTLFEGTIVVAKHQEQGRGQRGTTWESEPNENLTLSILLQPTFLKPDEQFLLNKVISLGVMQFVKNSLSFGEGWGEAKIKWPNDIYIGSKKVAGILIENSVSGSKLQQSIIGLGINVNQERFSAELPNPTSLKLITGKKFDLNECISELCSCIEKRYLELRANQISKIDADYLKTLYLFGEWANYKYKGDPDNYRDLKAKIVGVTKPGKLILEIETGEMLECDIKEVEFTPPSTSLPVY